MDTEASKKTGKAAREIVSREDQGIWKAAPGRPDPTELLKSQGATRLQELLPLRYERMATSPFSFYRGAALIMASDLSAMPNTGMNVQLCGDAHMANFGAFASPSRRLVFDINDFDETLPGPWEWDIKRLVTSVEICGRDRGFSKKNRRKAVIATARKYRKAMNEFADMNAIDVWYANIDVLNMLRDIQKDIDKKTGKDLAQDLKKAYSKDSTRAVTKLTHVVDGELRVVDMPPLVQSIRSLLPDSEVNALNKQLDESMEKYAQTLSPEHYRLYKQYSIKDAGRKVVGVGSVGTRAWIVVLEGKDVNDHLVLQIKEAEDSVLERFLPKAECEHHGQRIVAGQRMMQTSSDVMLGWVTNKALDGKDHDFYVRQLWDWKTSTDLTTIGEEECKNLGKMCGWTLARAHARSGNRFAISAYLGGGDDFDEAMGDFAEAYADQNEADYARFVQARGNGELDVSAE